MESVYHHDSGYETYYDGDGNLLAGLGQTVSPPVSSPTPAPAPSSLPAWLQNLLGAGSQIATTAAQVEAAKQIAKIVKVPTAQVNVGVSPEVKPLLIGGAIGLGVLSLFLIMSKRRR